MAKDTPEKGTPNGAAPSPAPRADSIVPAAAPASSPVASTPGTAAKATETIQANLAPADKANRRTRKFATPEAKVVPPAAITPPALPAKPSEAAPKVQAPVVATSVAPLAAPAIPAKAPVAKPVKVPAAKVAAAKPLPVKTVAAPVAPPEPALPPVAAKAADPVATRPGTDTPHAMVPAPLKTRVTPAAAAASRKEHPIMTTANEFSEKFQSAFKDASEKAKTAFEKSQAAFGDAGEFAKGNVEAVVESSKILASGLQELTKGYAAEGKSAMEALTVEIKDLATAKSPTEFFEKHTALMRKQFDAVVAVSSKHSEAVLKLANEAFQPISNRVSLAVEKMKVAA